MKDTFWFFLKGLGMGAADVVPGVSGGTIAFITGIYDRFIYGLKKLGDAGKELYKLNFKKAFKLVDFNFFVPLVLGIVASFLIGSAFLPDLISDYPAQVFSFFVGLILASAFVVYGHIKKHSSTGLLLMGLGIVAGYLVSTMPPIGGEGAPNPGWILVLGMIAICAMLLPGISGSYLLLIFGRYEFMLKMIHERNILYVSAFVIGGILGLLLFSRFLSWLLKKFHNSTFSALVGVMVGALANPIREIALNWVSPIVCVILFLIGLLTVIAIEKVA